MMYSNLQQLVAEIQRMPPEMTEIPTFVKNSVLMKLFVLISLVAQLDTLPPSPALYAALYNFFDQQLTAVLAEFDDAGPASG